MARLVIPAIILFPNSSVSTFAILVCSLPQRDLMEDTSHGTNDVEFERNLKVAWSCVKDATDQIDKVRETRDAATTATNEGTLRGTIRMSALKGALERSLNENLDIAEVIARRLTVPLVAKTRDEAGAHFTWFAHFASMNVTASSKQTQERLHWRPTLPGLIADLDQPYYFA
jgi:hypothetical protein